MDEILEMIFAEPEFTAAQSTYNDVQDCGTGAAPSLFDFNGDGIADAVGYAADTDFDGIYDKYIFEEFPAAEAGVWDGSPDTYQIGLDYNNDGIIDAVLEGIDADHDLTIDYFTNCHQLSGDDDVLSLFDGGPDFVVSGEEAISDLLSDGIAPAPGLTDFALHSPDDPSRFALQSPVYEADSFLFEEDYPLKDAPIACGGADAYVPFHPLFAPFGHILGDPEAYMDNWHAQETDHTCAVAAQEFVIEELLGISIEESELARIAEEHGWLDNGTAANDIGKLMEYMGLEVRMSEFNSMEDLYSCLERGNHPVVAVDADELWSGKNNEIFFPGRDANHAIQVIGVDMSDPAKPMVIINDSGVSNGCGAMIPADLFEKAWEDSGCLMVEGYI